METCTTIIGQNANLETIFCGERGVRIGEVVRCVEHWAQARNRRNQVRSRNGHKAHSAYLTSNRNAH